MDRYRRAGEQLEQWTAENILRRDREPSLLVIDQAFDDPVTGQRRVRRGLLALLKLSDPREGKVLPHERTLTAPKADRLELLRAVDAQLSPIFALFPDEGNTVLATVAGEVSREPDVTAELDGIEHLLWRVTAPALIEQVRTQLAPARAYIADGHHRYETALRFRELARAEGRRVEGTALDYIPAFLCSMSDPGLVVLPTHRVLHSLSFAAPRVLEKLAPFFTAERLDPPPGEEARGGFFRQVLADEASRGRHAFVMQPEEDAPILLVLRRDAPLEQVPSLPGNPVLRALDLSFLHGLIFEHVLGLSRASQERQENLRYVKRMEDALGQVRRGEGECAFLLNPVPLQQLRAVAEAGEAMPQKSTFFFPKIIDGLVAQPLGDEVP